MPRAIVTTHSNVYEGNDVFLTDRIIMADGTQLELADLDISDNITVAVYPMSGAGEGRVQGTSIFTKTDIDKNTGGPGGGQAIWDTYQTTYWDGRDNTGYNFVYQLQYDAAGSDGPRLRGGHNYRVEFSFRTTNFGTVRWAHTLYIIPTKAVS